MTSTIRSGPHDYGDLVLDDGQSEALNGLIDLLAMTRRAGLRPVQVPEVSARLDVERRADLAARFRYLHQSCLLHCTHFRFANQARVGYAIDAYLRSVSDLNPMGAYSSARVLLELYAMTRYVAKKLREAADESVDWQDRGATFFGVIVKARYGSTDPDKQAAMKNAGLPDDQLRNFKLNKARQDLHKELDWVTPHYAALCDFVHPNLSSQLLGGGSVGESQVASTPGGGAMVMSGGKTSIIQYSFPLAEAGQAAAQFTMERAFQSAEGAVKATNAILESPFTEAERVEWTGSKLGVEMKPMQPPRSVQKVGRNEPCPCGSGIKYKKCHGR